MRIRDWSSDVCSSDLWTRAGELRLVPGSHRAIIRLVGQVRAIGRSLNQAVKAVNAANRPDSSLEIQQAATAVIAMESRVSETINHVAGALTALLSGEVYYWTGRRSEEHQSELQSPMRISSAVLLLKLNTI